MDFELLYKRLNNEQKQAVDAIEGPVMVIAGPGTGKTEILTLRIANILNKTQVDADNILALTFTESGAMSMKKRLISIIGNDAYRVNINTFHGFCNEIIQDYPEYFENIAGFKNIDEVKQIEILKQVLDSLQLEYLTTFNNNYFFLRDIKSAIDELKKEGVSYSELRKLAEQLKHDFENNEDNYNPKTKQIKINVKPYYKTIYKNIELSYIFEKYQELMAKSSYYDYSDMIVEVLNTLKKDNDLLLIIQEQYQYFLVDEYQDTNTSQNQVLELLCNFHQNPNIFIVGDPKQAIFRFQGASIHNFAYFKSLYPTAIIIDLINNYRSSQLILDSAFFLIGRDKQLKSAIDYENKKIQIYTLPNSNQEAYFVVKKIRELLSNNINANDIAVLYRNHKDSDILVDLLEKFQIPFSIKKKINIFNDLDIQKLLLIVDTIYNYGNDSFLFKCMHIDFLNINPIDIYKIVNYCNQNHINGYDFLNSQVDFDLLSKDKIMFLKEKLAD